MPDTQQPTIDQFLTPEAMLTPGAAGALTMMITNALAFNFDTHRALTGLVISCLFGAMVLVASRSIWQKSLYYILNSLIIFCVALGATAVGSTRVTSFSVVEPAYAGAVERKATVKDLLNTQKAVFELKAQGGSPEQIKSLEAKQKELEAIVDEDDDDDDDAIVVTTQKSFFKPWIKCKKLKCRLQ